MYKSVISAGNRKVISSGTAISFENEPIIIEVFDEAQSVVKLQFVFNNNEEVKEQLMTTAVTGDVLCFTLTNFNSPIGAGTTKPISFARYKNMILYLHIRVTALSKSDKTLYYTIYADGGDDYGNK